MNDNVLAVILPDPRTMTTNLLTCSRVLQMLASLCLKIAPI